MSCLFVEHLTVIDCAFLDAGRGLVGESWIVDLELEGDLDEQSMVLDFGEVKRRLKRAIDRSLDHTLLVPRQAGELSLAEQSETVELLFRSDLGAFEHRSPTRAVSLIGCEVIDQAAVTAHLEAALAPELPPNVAQLRVALRHERIDGAFYHYTHGLKKHAGQCQRIAHGHRSRVEVRIDGRRDGALEQRVAAGWLDIYLGTRADVVLRGNGRVRFAYTAPEGRFELTLPENRVDYLDTDTTVERIADALADRLAPVACGELLEVRAYEGVMKGALARRPIKRQ